MKTIKLSVLLFTLITFFCISCQMDKEHISPKSSLIEKINITDNSNQTNTTYERVSESIDLNDNHDGFVTVTSEQNSNFKNYSIEKVTFSVKQKLFVITDKEGGVHEFDMIENKSLDYQEKSGEVFYSLATKTNARGIFCRTGCYALFAVMVAADGPAPVADILAALTLAECLHLCEN